MKKIIGLLIAGSLALATAAHSTVVLEQTLADETSLAHDATYQADLTGLKLVGLSGQAQYTSAATHAPVTFQDGTQATGSVTIGDYTVLGATAATNTLTVTSTSGLTGAQVALPGFVFRQGVNWLVGATTALTAENIRAALATMPNMTVSRIGSVITLTAPVGTAANSTAMASTVPSLLVVATPTFTGGRDNATFTINGLVLTQGADWTASGSSATTATSLASAINTAIGSFVTATANTPSAGVITILSDANGSAFNFAMQSSVAAITLSGSSMAGGTTASFSSGSSNLSIVGHTITLGTPVLYTGSASIPTLTSGTTYFAIPVNDDVIRLATSKSNAVAGTAVTFGAPVAHLSANTGTLAPLAISGRPSFKWQSSDDGITWADIAVSSVTMMSYITPYRTEAWNFGDYSFNFVRANVLGPTTGGIVLRLYVRGTNQAQEQFNEDDKLFAQGPNTPGPLTVNGTVTATSYFGDGSNLTGIASGGALAAETAARVAADNVLSASTVSLNSLKLDKSGTSALSITGSAGTITTQSSVTASAFYGNGSNLTGISSGGETNTFGPSSKTFTGSVLVSSNMIVTGNVQASTFNAVGTAYQMNGVTVIDSNRNVTGASVTASSFFGNGANLSGVTAAPAPVTLEYTGTPARPIYLPYTGAAYVPASATSGAASYPASSQATVGSLSITDSGISSMSFTNVFAAGDVNITFPVATSLSFPSLTNANSLNVISGTTNLMTSLDVHALTNTFAPSSGNSFSLTNLGISDLNLGSLATVGGAFLLQNLPSVTLFENPLFTNILGNFTVSGLTALNPFTFPALTSIGGNFTATTLVVGALTFPALTNVGGNFNSIFVLGNQLPVLATVGGTFNPTGPATATTMSFPSLSTVTVSFSPSTLNSLTSVNFNSLYSVGSAFTPTTMAALTSWSLPSLSSVAGAFSPTTMGAVTTWSVPSLATVGGVITFTTMANLTTVNVSSLTTVGGSITANTGLGNLTNMTLGTIGITKAFNGAAVNFSGQKLTQASVDGILCLIASLDGTNGTTSWGAGKTLTLTGGTNSTPSAAGLVCKAVITGRGATVTNN